MDLNPPFFAFFCWYYCYDFLGGRVLSNYSCFGSLLWHMIKKYPGLLLLIQGLYGQTSPESLRRAY